MASDPHSWRLERRRAGGCRGGHVSSAVQHRLGHLHTRPTAAVQDLLGNQLDIAFLPMTPGYQQMIKAGHLKHLAVLAPERIQAFPGIPTLSELDGFKDFNFSIWGGVFVSADTPESEAAELGGIIYNVVTSPSYVQWTVEQGVTPSVRANSKEIGAYWTQETKKYLDLAKGAGLTQ